MFDDSLVERFWSKVDKRDDGCWIWMGSQVNGYGQFSVGRKGVQASRFCYELLCGPVPDNKPLRPRCGKPSCVNPDHLMAGCDESELRKRAIDRFWSKVIKSDGCWGWQGTCYRANGYARMWDGRRTMMAHRFSWELHNGSVPDGLHVLHRCDNPTCTNPNHLWLGSIADNNKDRAAKGRSCRGDAHWQRKHPERRKRGDDHWTRRRPDMLARGVNNGGSKLTESSVREIRSLVEEGFTQEQIACWIGVGQSTISSVLLRKIWKHVR